MKITSVTYRTNRASAENKFVHQHIELTAKMGTKDTPEKVLEQLKTKAQALLFPELVGLGERLKSASPLVAKVLGQLEESDLADLYTQNREEFESLFSGEIAPREFLNSIGY